jgi:DNA-binding MarR family transcriptional regulator
MTGQARPKTLHLTTSSTFLLVAAGRKMQQRLEGELATLGVTLRHLGALGHLSTQPDLSYSDLARRVGVTAQSMHATVRQLEALAAVSRQEQGRGHRARLVVTDLGRDLLERAAVIAHQIDDELLAEATASQREALRTLVLGIALPPSLRK